LSLSKLGGRLCVDGKAVVSWEDKVTRGGDDKTLRLIDESISQVGGILEQMKKVETWPRMNRYPTSIASTFR
jgi:hypothetical protein